PEGVEPPGPCRGSQRTGPPGPPRRRSPRPSHPPSGSPVPASPVVILFPAPFFPPADEGDLPLPARDRPSRAGSRTARRGRAARGSARRAGPAPQEHPPEARKRFRTSLKNRQQGSIGSPLRKIVQSLVARQRPV